ncbi:MAG: restriction endonuclease subunit S [Chitinophagales bacterium]
MKKLISMSEWKKVKLGDVVSKLGDGLHGTPKYTPNGEFYFINGNNLGDGKIRLKANTKRVSKEEYNKYKKELNDRTILVSINGTLGNIGLYNNEKCILGKSACYFNVKTNICKNFIRYIVTNTHFQKYISVFANGSTIKNVSLKTMREYPFKLPPLAEQKAIAGVLSSLDDKIDVLHRQNKTLEAMAETLFRQWFVEEAKEDWEEVKIKDFNCIVTDYVANGSFAALKKNVTYTNIPNHAILIRLTDFNRNFASKFVYINEHSYKFLKKSQLKPNDIIISNVGAYAGTVFRCPNLKKPMVLGPNAIVIKSMYNNFFYYFFKSRYGKYLLDGIRSGSAQPKFNKTAFRNIKLQYSSIEHLNNFEIAVNPYVTKKEKNITQIRTLENLRDTLLPKLMNGKISVSF